jgi:pimeloyl-ACP methyl ester carboxylesterase
MSTEAAATGSPHYTVPQTIEAGGAVVAYRRKGDGPATVFLHGAGSTRMWLALYEVLSREVDFFGPLHP